jgi:beta-glucosidase
MENYGVQNIFITENGCGYNEETLVDGEVHDLHRREILRAYLRELQRAIHDGVPVRGYFVWTLMDNFERRFGIVHVDFATQVRTPKLSARYHSAVIRENRIM